MKRILLALSLLAASLTLAPSWPVAVLHAATHTDDFNRADSADLGASWTPITGLAALQISGNIVYAGTQFTTNGEYWSANTVNDDQYSQVAIVTRAGSSAEGPACRISESAATYYAVAQDGFAGHAIEIWESTAGSLAVLQDTGAVAADGDVLKIECEGTSIRAYQNGAQVGTTVTDASIASGRAGMHLYGNVSNAIDNWEGGDLGGGGGCARGGLLLRGIGC